MQRINMTSDKNSDDDIGYIYCLSNESYHNTYKIGYTKNDPVSRISQLNTTGLLFPFKLEFAKQVINHQDKEKKLHAIFDKYRVNKNREFFKLELKEIKQLFDLIDGEWYKPGVLKKEPAKLLPLSDSRYKPVLSIKPQSLSEKSSLFGAKSSNPSYSSTQCIENPIKIIKPKLVVKTKPFISHADSEPEKIINYAEYMNKNKISANQVITHCGRCFDKFEKSFMIINCIHDNICKHCTTIIKECPKCKTPYN